MDIAVDTSAVVALVAPGDPWRGAAEALIAAIVYAGHRAVYLDCVAAEAVSVVVRRMEDKRRTVGIPALLHVLASLLPESDITWILRHTQRLYPDILALVRSSHGTLNFNDALIALVCRESGIPAIASFDADFDQLPWLRRLGQPSDL